MDTVDDIAEAEGSGGEAPKKGAVQMTADELADEEWGPVKEKGKKAKKGKGKKGKALDEDEDEGELFAWCPWPTRRD